MPLRQEIGYLSRIPPWPTRRKRWPEICTHGESTETVAMLMRWCDNLVDSNTTPGRHLWVIRNSQVGVWSGGASPTKETVCTRITMIIISYRQDCLFKDNTPVWAAATTRLGIALLSYTMFNVPQRIALQMLIASFATGGTIDCNMVGTRMDTGL